MVWYGVMWFGVVRRGVGDGVMWWRGAVYYVLEVFVYFYPFFIFTSFFFVISLYTFSYSLFLLVHFYSLYFLHNHLFKSILLLFFLLFPQPSLSSFPSPLPSSCFCSTVSLSFLSCFLFSLLLPSHISLSFHTLYVSHQYL